MSSNTIINGDINAPLTFSSPITTTIESGLLTINSNNINSNDIMNNNIIDSSSDSGNLTLNANNIYIKTGIYPVNTNNSSSNSGNVNVNANVIIIGNTAGNAQVNGDLAITGNINSLSNNTLKINGKLIVDNLGVSNITTQLSINNNLIVSGDVSANNVNLSGNVSATNVNLSGNVSASNLNLSGNIKFSDNSVQTSAFKTLSPNPANTYVNPSSIVINDKGQITSATSGNSLTPGSYTNSSITVGSNGQISVIANGSVGGSGPTIVNYNLASANFPFRIPDNLGNTVEVYINITSTGSNNAIVLPNATVLNSRIKICITNVPTFTNLNTFTLYAPSGNPNFMQPWQFNDGYGYRQGSVMYSLDISIGDEMNFNSGYGGVNTYIWWLYSQKSRPTTALRPLHPYGGADSSYIGYLTGNSFGGVMNYSSFRISNAEIVGGTQRYMYKKNDFPYYGYSSGIWSVAWLLRIWDTNNQINKNCNIFAGIQASWQTSIGNNMFDSFNNGMNSGFLPGTAYIGDYNIHQYNYPSITDTYSAYNGSFVSVSNGGQNIIPFIAFGNQPLNNIGNISVLFDVTIIRIG